jgi:hypothetical protein
VARIPPPRAGQDLATWAPQNPESIAQQGRSPNTRPRQRFTTVPAGNDRTCPWTVLFDPAALDNGVEATDFSHPHFSQQRVDLGEEAATAYVSSDPCASMRPSIREPTALRAQGARRASRRQQAREHTVANAGGRLRVRARIVHCSAFTASRLLMPSAFSGHRVRLVGRPPISTRREHCEPFAGIVLRDEILRNKNKAVHGISCIMGFGGRAKRSEKVLDQGNNPPFIIRY